MKHLQNFGDFTSLNESGISSNTRALLSGDISGVPIGNARDLISAIKEGIKGRPSLIFAPPGAGITAALKSGLKNLLQLDGSTLTPVDLALPGVGSGKATMVETELMQKMRDSDYVVVSDIERANAQIVNSLVKLSNERGMPQMIFTAEGVNAFLKSRTSEEFLGAMRDRLFVLYYMPEK